MKRVYCLYRVSTKGQVDKDDIPMQKTSCREFAEHNGWTILKEFQENGNREVHYANRSELFNNIIQAYSPVTDSDFDEASDDKKKKNENLKTSPNAEQTDSDDTINSEQQDESTEEPENSNVEQNADKQRKVVIRTERPPQEVLDNE